MPFVRYFTEIECEGEGDGEDRKYIEELSDQRDI